jgi:sulfite exporter TauE/SafE
MSAANLAADWSTATLWAAFLLGLTGGFGHCLMMCGPFVAAASLAEGHTAATAAGPEADAAACTTAIARPSAGIGRGVGFFQVSYHLGRLITYAAIGAIVGALGSAGALETLSMPWSPAAFTRYVKLAAGLMMVFAGLVLLAGPLTGRSSRLPEPTRFITSASWFSRATGRLMRAGAWAGLPLGLLMGLLPCMPLLPVELAALASGSAGLGALTMLAFGIGTVPALAGFGLATGLLGARARGNFAYAAGAIVVALGAFTILQALQRLGASAMPPMTR